MAKYWESIALAAVLSASSINASAADENVTSQDASDNSVEYTQDVRDEMKDDSTLAWEELNRLDEGDLSEGEYSKEELALQMLLDARKFKDDMLALELADVEQSNEVDSPEKTAENLVMSCMVSGQSEQRVIAHRYGCTPEEYEALRAEGKFYVYGDFLEHLAVNGDKELGAMLGVDADHMTPQVITMALALAPKIPYEKQEELYNRAMEDGRYDEYVKNGVASYRRYAENDLTAVIPENGARVHIGLADSQEMARIIKERYGSEAEVLIVDAMLGNEQLAQQFGYSDQDKPDHRQMIYNLAYGEKLPQEMIDSIATPERKEEVGVILNYVAENRLAFDCFEYDAEAEVSKSNLDIVAHGALKEKEVKDKIASLKEKVQEQCVVTEAKENQQEGDVSRTTQVKRSVKGITENEAVEITVITEEIQKKNENVNMIGNTVTNYSVVSGVTIDDSVHEVKEVSRRDGSIKTIIEENESTLYRENGVVAESMGYKYDITTSSSSVSKSEYDRKGRVKSLETHAEIVASNKTIKRDQKMDCEYNYKGEENTDYSIGDSERYEIKRDISAYADATYEAINLHIKSGNNKKTFEGNINSNGSEIYVTTKKGKTIEVKVTEDGVSGAKYDLSTGEMDELSRKQLKSELKKARKEADRVIDEVTNGKFGAVEEYMQDVRMANINGKVPKATYMFDMTSDQRNAASSVSKEDTSKHREKVAAKKSITAEDIMRQRLAENRIV